MISSGVQFVIKFCGENLNLLKEVQSRLAHLDYRPSLHRNHKKGDFSYYNGKKIKYNKDYYILEITNKPQVLELLSILPLRDREKIAKNNQKISIDFFSKHL